MVIAMPPESSFDSGSSVLNDINFSQAKSAYDATKSSRSIDLQIPKFKFESTVPLVDIMKDLGVNEIFQEKSNAMERMFNNPKGFYVAEAIHTATINVNEIGAVASAVTVIQATSRSGPTRFVVNRPFKFFITNKRHSTLYFAGAVHNLS